jgi:hypothetical protein
MNAQEIATDLIPRVHHWVPSMGFGWAEEIALIAPILSNLTSGIEFHA